MLSVQASVGPAHILKPPFGSDLLKELEDFVRAKGINLAWLSGVGAVSRATIRYYDQPKQEWIDLEFDQRLEVAGMLGNVSLMNGEPIVHVHITRGRRTGPLLRRSPGARHPGLQPGDPADHPVRSPGHPQDGPPDGADHLALKPAEPRLTL